MAKLTNAKIRKFVKLRNTKGVKSNLSFQSDCRECGFDAADLGQAYKRQSGGYRWDVLEGALYEEPDGVTLRFIPEL